MTEKQIEDRLRLERTARKELRQMRSLLAEQGGSKVKEAFLDVFRALRLAAMDISNSLRLAIGIIFTFDPDKINKQIEAFDTRRQKINAEWAPIKERAREAFKNTDPILTMAVMGPANFLAMQGLGAGLAAGKTAAEIVTATNWNEITNSFTTTLDLNQSLQQFFQKYSKDEEKRQEREEKAAGSVGRGRGVLSRLSNLFSEGESHVGTVITEQAVPPEGQQFSEDQAIDIFTKVTGMDKGFEKIRKASLENLVETVKAIQTDIEPMRSSALLFAANDFETFQRAFAEVKSKNPKVNAAAFNKFKDVLVKETEKLSKDPKFSEELKKQAGGSAVTPEQTKVAAEKKVFQVTKEQFDKQLADGLGKAVKAGEDAIKKLGVDDSVLKAMKSSPYQDSRDAAKVYENLLSVYKEIKSDFESKAKSKAK